VAPTIEHKKVFVRLYAFAVKLLKLLDSFFTKCLQDLNRF
jgi:hypothetical protein